MDDLVNTLYSALYYVSLFLIPFAYYSVFLKKKNTKDWFYLIKLFYAKSVIKNYQNQCKSSLDKSGLKLLENVRRLDADQYTDRHFINGADQKGNSLSLKIIIRAGLSAEAYLSLRLSNGAIYTIPGEQVELCNISSWTWKTKDLHIEIVEPFKRLRIIYNGLLENKTNHVTEHVKFNFIWASGGRPQFYPQDSATALLADSLASETWRDGSWVNLLGDEKGYEQFGALQGTLRGDSFKDELNLYLPSCRSRFWGRDEKLAVKSSIYLFIARNDGLLFSIWAKNIKDGVRALKYGNVILSNGEILTIADLHIDLETLIENKNNLRAFPVRVTAGKTVYNCILHLEPKNAVKTKNIESRGYEVTSAAAECEIDINQARSLVEIWTGRQGQGLTLPPPHLTSNNFDNLPEDYVVGFKNEIASCVKLSGGKGSSLAMLATLNSNEFAVPDGFIVTVNAFNKQLEKNSQLKKAVSNLDDIFCGRVSGNQERACAETVKLFTNTPVPAEITDAVKKALNSVKSDDVIFNKRFAVRSSGVSEDGEELSAAGQNETILGCQFFYDIIQAISKCWASLFAFQSVQYRHQHGLPIATEMAVVVQLMVPSDCAGVLFTCHPSTTNPALLVITANHGLGESVVSGKTEPDTVTLTKDLKITSKIAGSKSKIIKMTSEGVAEFDSDNQDFSITDEQAKKLAKVGVDLEECFGGSRDIEWAFYRDKLYLLQSRPVTTLENWSDEELLHEFDTAALSDNVLYTMANVGEVFPGTVTTLTETSIITMLDKGVQANIVRGKAEEFALRATPTFQHRLFIDAISSLYMVTSEKIQLLTKILDLTVFGHPVIDDEINAMAIKRFGITSKLQGIKNLLRQIRLAWGDEKRVKNFKSVAKSLEILGVPETDTVQDIYLKIDKFLGQGVEFFKLHSSSSTVSVFYQMISFNILAEGADDLTSDHYQDIADLLSSCSDVVSAEIPTTLENIARLLVQNKKIEAFAKVNPEDGREWLLNNRKDAGKLFDEFIEEHGHRGNAEFEMRSSTWSMQPEQVIKLLQANCSQVTTRPEKAVKSLDDVIKDLLSPKSNVTRKILKFLMKYTRTAVGRREQTKNELIRVVAKTRIAYRKLANKMRLAGLIPEEDLIFHLSHYEIGQIIKERSPTLIRKALRRQRLYTKWNTFTYPELSYGIPKPENNEEIRVGEGKIKCEGTPVCAGVVKARACVILDLKEIHKLNKGDILITHSTDIGWSAYFPMLAGIVTELGGLVSHGAVVAREYGLPCIVGVQKATKIFKTGDIVVLSGKVGILELASDNK